MITHFHANRLFTECYLQKEFFDLVDIDSFGGDTSFLRSALCVVKIGGFQFFTDLSFLPMSKYNEFFIKICMVIDLDIINN